MTAKRDRDLICDIERLGYGFDRTNSKGAHFYIHEDTGCEIKIVPGLDERRARHLLDMARHQIGLPTKDNKRNPAQIRERNLAEHMRAASELEAARARLGNLSRADEARVRAAEEAWQRADRKFRYWDRLMRECAS